MLGLRFSAGGVCCTGGLAPAAGPSDLIISDVEDLRRFGLLTIDKYGDGVCGLLFGDWVEAVLPKVAVLRLDS